MNTEDDKKTEPAVKPATEKKKPAVVLDKPTTSTHDVEIDPKLAAKVKEAKKPPSKSKKGEATGSENFKAESAKIAEELTASPTPKTAAETSPGKYQMPPQNPEFRTLRTVEELVDAYNDMVPTAVDFGLAARTVKSFADTKTGVLACERLHHQIQKSRTAPTKSDKKEQTTMAKKASKKTAKKAKTATARTPRAKFDPKAKIEWLGKDNPFREGSEKHKRAELVRKYNGKTVGAYLEAGGNSGTLGRCVGTYKLVKVHAPAK